MGKVNVNELISLSCDNNETIKKLLNTPDKNNVSEEELFKLVEKRILDTVNLK